MSTATITTSDVNPLTAGDRCDRCGAQAYIRVTMPSGFELLFCIHHAADAHDKLVISALRIEDFSTAMDN